MAYDLKLDSGTGDLVPGFVTGDHEILQRVKMRLNRELGEWFLNTSAGIPWFQDGNGLLGSKNRQILTLYVRREVLNTEGVLRILTFNLVYESLTRHVSIYMKLLLDSGEIEPLLYEYTLNSI